MMSALRRLDFEEGRCEEERSSLLLVIDSNGTPENDPDGVDLKAKIYQSSILCMVRSIGVI